MFGMWCINYKPGHFGLVKCEQMLTLSRVSDHIIGWHQLSVSDWTVSTPGGQRQPTHVT